MRDYDRRSGPHAHELAERLFHVYNAKVTGFCLEDAAIYIEN